MGYEITGLQDCKITRYRITIFQYSKLPGFQLQHNWIGYDSRAILWVY